MELKNIAGIKKQMQDDISVLNQVVAACSQADTRSGLEGYEDGGKVFVEAASSFKARYGKDVEPTLAGMEALVADLQAGLAKLEGVEAAQGILTFLNLGAESLRSEYTVAASKMGGDIHVITSMIANQRDGIEGMEDGGTHFAHMASTIKESYGVEIEPTLSGMEGFLGKLKDAFKAAVGQKRKPLESIINSIYDLEKGVATLKENAAKRGVKEGEGTVTLSAPKSLGKNVTPEAIGKSAKQLGDKIWPQLTKAGVPAKATLIAGLKVFNKYAKHEVPETEAEFKKLVAGDFPIKPGHPEDDYRRLMDKDSLVGVELKLLDKAGVDKAIAVLDGILEIYTKFAKYVDDVDSGAMDHSEIADSAFWDAYWDEEETEELCDAVYFQSVTRALYSYVWGWGADVEPGVKLLEQWINASLK